jgi:hypothetical protein
MTDEEASLDDPRWRERADGAADASPPTDGAADGAATEGERERAGDSGEPDPVEVGVALLSRLEHAELSMAAALDRIEAVTTAPERQRAILEAAEARGLIEREDGQVRPTGTGGRGYVRFESEVVVRHGEFTCKRCGATIGEGHFVQVDPGEVGPFGSSCVRKVLGRE